MTSLTKLFKVRVLIAVLPMFLFLVPQAAFAANATFFGPIVPAACHCDNQPNPTTGGAPITTAPAWGCILQVIQNSINLLISLSLIICVLYIAYAGAILVTSAGSPGAREQGKQRLINAVVGLLVILSAWLIVDFVMKTLYNDDTKTGFGPWNAILAGDGDNSCIVAREPESIVSGTIGIATGTTTPVFTTGPIQSRICAAANSYRGKSTAACNCGGNACAWAVNQVLQLADVKPMGGASVVAMRSALEGGRGQFLSLQSTAQCGDLVLIVGSQTSGGNSANHVGICLNSGCTQVISNSSSNRTFSWSSAPDFKPSYINAKYRIYRVTN